MHTAKVANGDHVTSVLACLPGWGYGSISVNRRATVKSILAVKNILAPDVKVLGVLEVSLPSQEERVIEGRPGREVIRKCLDRDHNIDEEPSMTASTSRELESVISAVNRRTVAGRRRLFLVPLAIVVISTGWTYLMFVQ